MTAPAQPRPILSITPDATAEEVAAVLAALAAVADLAGRAAAAGRSGGPGDDRSGAWQRGYGLRAAWLRWPP